MAESGVTLPSSWGKVTRERETQRHLGLRPEERVELIPWVEATTQEGSLRGWKSGGMRGWYGRSIFAFLGKMGSRAALECVCGLRSDWEQLKVRVERFGGRPRLSAAVFTLTGKIEATDLFDSTHYSFYIISVHHHLLRA
jgi:hypothetical protein